MKRTFNFIIGQAHSTTTSLGERASKSKENVLAFLLEKNCRLRGSKFRECRLEEICLIQHARNEW